MEKGFIVFVLVITLIYLVEYISSLDRTTKVRLSQVNRKLKNMNKNNKFKDKIVDSINRKTSYKKRYAEETFYLQSGINSTYGEILYKRIILGILVAILVGFFMNNPFLGLLSGIVAQAWPRLSLSRKRQKRYSLINKQTGSMMNMLISRYSTMNNFHRALEMTTDEFKGIEPMYSELRHTLAEVNETNNIIKSLNNLARRTNNDYIQLLADYFEVALEIGGDQSAMLLNQAYIQYEEKRKLMEEMERKLSQTVSTAYLFIFAIPLFSIAAYFIMPGFAVVVRTQLLGKVIITGVSLVFFLAIWYVEKNVKAPL